MQKKDWFLDEQFWLTHASVFFDARRWAEAGGIADSVLRVVGVPQSEIAQKKILDAGCGPGRIAVELAARGAQVTGVDVIAAYLDAAKDSAQAEGVTVEFVQADLRNFVRPDYFDVAVNLYTSFGYCAQKSEDLKILQNIAASLKKGGWFIMEIAALEIEVREFTDGEWFDRGGFTVLTEYEVLGAWEHLSTRIILIDKDGHKTDSTYVRRLYSAAELKEMFLHAGFQSVEVYGDYAFSPYNETAKTAVLIGRT